MGGEGLGRTSFVNGTKMERTGSYIHSLHSQISNTSFAISSSYASELSALVPSMEKEAS